MEEHAAIRIEDLLARSDWIRRLAASLARDPDRAEDLAQATLAVALERGPAPGVPVRRWLAAVMRNLLRQDRRAERRRERREMRAARPEADFSEIALLGRLDVQRSVVEAVRSLGEPHRSAVLMRYFEGLSPPEIARRTGAPLRTVHSRLHRALHILRSRLDTEHGGRRAWLASLIPLSPKPGAFEGALGMLLMKTKLQIALLAAAAALLIALCIQLAGGLEAADPVVEAERSAPGDPETVTSALSAAIEGQDRETIPPVEPTQAAPGGSESASDQASGARGTAAEASLRGRVIDVEGRPVAGVEIRVGPFGSAPRPGVRIQPSWFLEFEEVGSTGVEDGASATEVPAEATRAVGVSAAGGKFEIPRPSDGSVLHARSERLIPVLAFDWYGTDPSAIEPVLVVAERSPVAGVVVDDHGQPIEGVEIAVRAPEGLKASLGTILDRAEVLEHFARSGPDGRFEIAGAPWIEGRHVHAFREGSPTHGQPISAGPELDLRIVFQLTQEYAVAARGIVLDARGEPAAGASVRTRGGVTKSAGDGRFVLDATAAQAGDEILAAKPGFAPGRAVFAMETESYTLRLGPPTLRLAGRVIDEGGKPMSSVEVRALGLTRVDGVPLEELATWDGPGPFTQNDTNEEGRFEIAGLRERAYVLGLLDRRSMRYMRSDPLPAGRSDVEIRFRSGTPHGRIAGSVVDRAGRPVSRARVTIVAEIVREEGGRNETVETVAFADGEGRFELPDVSLEVRAARVARADDLDFEHPLDGGMDLQRLVLVAYRRGHVQIDLAGSGVGADGFEILDESGRGMPIVKYEGNVATATMRWPISGERSDALTALDAAETVVLYRGGQEVRRLPVRIVPGELTVVRP